MEDSLKKKFSAKVLSNVLTFAMSSVITILVPRSLGPSDYGNFSYLNHFFSKVFGFFSLGSLLAFFTKLSQRPKEHKMIRFYVFFLLFVLVISILFLTTIYITGSEKLLLNEIKLQVIVLAFAYSFLLYLINIVRQVNDAYGFTVMSEKFFMVQKLLSLLIVVSLYFFNALNLVFYFVHLILVLSLLLFTWIYYLDSQKIKPFAKVNRFSKFEVKKYISEFYTYSHPLFTLGAIALLLAIAERWLLQYFGGSEEQGFYSFSFAITSIIFLFTGALAPLFTRDFSIAWGKKDFTHMRYLYNRFIPPLIALASFFSFFVAANGDKIGVLLGGRLYANAGLSIAVMSVYPIHQTYGQLCGSVFFASGKTKLMRNISVPFNILGFCLTAFLLLPDKYGGLDLGSLGLVYKMVFIQFLVVNFYLYHCSKILNVPFLESMIKQIAIIAAFAGLAFLVNMLFELVFDDIMLQLILSGFLYTILSVLMVVLFPTILVSSKRSELLELFNKILKKNKN
jgi:O-antigen/teichoic acid export membrane protein